MAKVALIAFGNEESYGLSFVGGELLEHGQEIRFFDGDYCNWLDIVKWSPDFLMFSPLTTFFPKAIKFAKALARSKLKATTVFGGHHVLSCPDIAADVVVLGPVRGSIERILAGERGIIKTSLTCPADMPKPAREQYFKDIPRIAKRYRKFMMSMLGCIRDCSYCSSSSSHIKGLFGAEAYRNYYMRHRPIKDVLGELDEVMGYDTKEIDWVDDDVFAGDESWMLEFIKHVSIPMYVSTSSLSVIKASDRFLRKMRKCVDVVGMGVQAIRPSTLKLCGRGWDSEAKMKCAYDKLTSFGYKVNLQGIVGFPVDDPLEDAIETVMGMQRIGKGSICSLYPLMIYPGTKMEKLCRDWPKNEQSAGDTNTGVCDLKLADSKQLKNLCKLATFIIKYGIDKRLVRILINADYENVSKDLSTLRYRECVVDRLGDEGKRIFYDIINTMNLKF